MIQQDEPACVLCLEAAHRNDGMMLRAGGRRAATHWSRSDGQAKGAIASWRSRYTSAEETPSFMPREITWNDTLEIGIQLQEKHPDVDPYTVRFTDLHKWVTELPGFVGDPAKSNESLLEAIQTAWHEEFEDAKNG